MCLATVEDCEGCQRSSCRGIKICSSAQSQGKIHITRSAYDTARAIPGAYLLLIDVFNPVLDTYLMKIYTVMEQIHIQTQHCSQCDSATVPTVYPVHRSRCCVTTHQICKNTNKHGDITIDHGPLQICEAVNTGLIHIRKDAYHAAHDPKIKIPVFSGILKGKVGQFALVYEAMEEDEVFSGTCWLCRRT